VTGYGGGLDPAFHQQITAIMERERIIVRKMARALARGENTPTGEEHA